MFPALRMPELRDPHLGTDRRPRAWFADVVRFVLAPLVLFFVGYFTADFAVSGLYTWPRTSRVLVLTLTVIIFAYEFIYKEQGAAYPERSREDHLRAVFFACVLPYGLGGLTLLFLARLSL